MSKRKQVSRVKEPSQLLVFIEEDAEACHFIMARKSEVPDDVWVYLIRGNPIEGSFDASHVPACVNAWYQSVMTEKRPDVLRNDGSMAVPRGVVVERVRIFRTFC